MRGHWLIGGNWQINSKTMEGEGVKKNPKLTSDMLPLVLTVPTTLFDI